MEYLIILVALIIVAIILFFTIKDKQKDFLQGYPHQDYLRRGLDTLCTYYPDVLSSDLTPIGKKYSTRPHHRSCFP